MSAPVALFANPRASRQRRDRALLDRLASQLPASALVCCPTTLDELAVDARRVRDAGVSRVFMLGGDGTLHRLVTALVAAAGESGLPEIGILPGGRMNIVAWSVGVHGRPERVLAKLLAAGQAARHTTRFAMRISGAEHPQYGFLFGNGVIARFLEVYYRRPDPTPAHAALDLARGVASTVVGGPFSRALLRRWAGELAVDGAPWAGDDFLAVAVGTVEQIGLGFAPFAGVGQQPGRLRLHAVGSTMFGLARELPRVYFGGEMRAPGNRSALATDVQLVSASGASTYMIDGDFHRAGASVHLTPAAPVRVIVP